VKNGRIRANVLNLFEQINLFDKFFRLFRLCIPKMSSENFCAMITNLNSLFTRMFPVPLQKFPVLYAAEARTLKQKDPTISASGSNEMASQSPRKPDFRNGLPCQAD
jgi:hypothetical protein